MSDLVPNTPLKRFDHVVKTYGESGGPFSRSIIFDVASITASLLGEDEAVGAFQRLGNAYNMALYEESKEHGDIEAEQWWVGRADAAWNEMLDKAHLLFDTGHHQYEHMIPWIASKLAKLAKQVGIESGVYDAIRARLRREITSIAQWASASRVDIGRYDIMDALDEADAYMREQKAKEAAKGEVVWRFKDGSTIEELTTREQLDTEGDVMGHCVGSYCAKVSRGGSRIYSLRDPRGRSHVTLEWDPNVHEWEQIRGKQNAPPVEKYHDQLDEFIKGFAPPGAAHPDARAVDLYRKGLVEQEAEKIDDDGLALITRYVDGRLEEGQGISMRDLDPHADGPVVVALPQTMFGEYGGTIYNKYAYKQIEKMFPDGHPDLHELYGSGDAQGWAIRGGSNDEKMVELLENFATYDIHDVPYELEQEEQESVWSDWGRAEFVHEVSVVIVGETDDEGAAERWGELADVMDADLSGESDEEEKRRSMLMEAFEGAREASNEDWYEEGNSLSIRIGSVAEQLTPEIVADALLDNGKHIKALTDALEAQGPKPELVEAAKTMERIYKWGRSNDWRKVPDAAPVARALAVVESL